MENQTDASEGNGHTSLTLLNRIRAHDAEAWMQVVTLYRPLVAHWCGRWGVVREDADDAIQEVFQAAWAGLPDFRRDRPGDTFRGWLRGITRNQLLMHFRRTGRHPQASGRNRRLATVEADRRPAGRTAG